MLGRACSEQAEAQRCPAKPSAPCAWLCSAFGPTTSALFLSTSQFPIAHLHLEPPCPADGPPHPDWVLCKTCHLSSSPSQYQATIQQAWALGGHSETLSVSGGPLKGLVYPVWDLEIRTNVPPVFWLGAGGAMLLRAEQRPNRTQDRCHLSLPRNLQACHSACKD